MKRVASAKEIRAEIQRRIDTSEWAAGFNPPCVAPMPYRITYDGISNWMANVGAMATPGCEGFVLDIVASLRQEYDLPPQTLRDTIAHLLSSRKSPF
jgi:hypothetical protein